MNQRSTFLAAALLFSTGLPTLAQTNNFKPENKPETLKTDGRVHLVFGPEILIVPRGLQPSILCTTSGTLIVQGQIPEKPLPSNRQTYPSAMETRISRDDGKTWNVFPRPANQNGINLEGGALQLEDGTILALDTYITPDDKPDEGLGQLYTSVDDWHTLTGPEDIFFQLPGPNYNTKDDGGRPYRAERLHRRIIELPNGDLLTTVYGSFKGDSSPATYMPSMLKSRTILVRSHDRGKHWKFVSVVAALPTAGTEGYVEPVLQRLSQGPHPGRLMCLMRTGRELRETISDDDGVTWAPAKPLVFAGLDVYRTDLWVNHFRHLKFGKKFLDENDPDDLRGAVVDPDLIELRNGVLVAAFGVRIPQKACWQDPTFPWNGNYLAFSLDHGETWKNVVRLTTGVLTTHYMAITETTQTNRIFVSYDLGAWKKGANRDIWGRFVTVSVK